MARLLLMALRETGHAIELASEFRTFDGEGNGPRQQRIKDIGNRLGRRLLRRYAREAKPPQLWFTYHVYHKAPDWIGPLVCDALHIPYVLAEASYAPKQADGPWQVGHNQCRLCIHRAEALVSLNDQDLPCLHSLVDPRCMLVDLKPFLPMERLAKLTGARPKIAHDWGIPADVPWLVCTAMMRAGDKLASFTRLSQALRKSLDQQWHLIMIGDGIVRDQVEALFEPMRDRITMTGLLDRERIFSILKSSDIYVWPAVNEAYGMALLEAQACGLPVVAGEVGGVARIVAHGRTGLLAAQNDEESFGSYVRQMIINPDLRREMGVNALHKCKHEHDYTHAVQVLADTFKQLR